MIAAGRLRHRVEIEKPSTERNSFGRQKKDSADWTSEGFASAEIKTLTGREGEVAQQLVAEASHRITVRVQRGFTLTTAHRFVFRSRYFDIGHVDNVDEVNSIWVCLVRETKR